MYVSQRPGLSGQLGIDPVVVPVIIGAVKIVSSLGQKRSWNFSFIDARFKKQLSGIVTVFCALGMQTRAIFWVKGMIDTLLIMTNGYRNHLTGAYNEAHAEAIKFGLTEAQFKQLYDLGYTGWFQDDGTWVPPANIPQYSKTSTGSVQVQQTAQQQAVQQASVSSGALPVLLIGAVLSIIAKGAKII